MTLSVSSWAGILLAALAAAGCLYEAIAIALLLRFFRRAPARAAGNAGATLLKPLHGNEPHLKSNLASFLRQDYAGPIQMVCGVTDSADPAAAVVAELQRDHPDEDIVLVGMIALPFANGKVANLVNMAPAAHHDILLLSDSDMAVQPDYLAIVTGALAQPGTGAVTCAYRGRGNTGFWSLLSAGAISYVALPGVIVGYVSGLARPCMGSTIALRRETLQAIGGFERFADVLADDYAIGEAVAETGQRIDIAPVLLVHGCSEESFGALWRQKLRWSATIRGVARWRHAGSVITYPLPLALLAALFLPTIGLPLALAGLSIRLAVALAVDNRARERSAPYWMLPAIECVEFLTFLASFMTQKIDWRGSRLTMDRDGRITG